MSQHEGILIDKISFLTAEQQERVLKFIEHIEAEEPSNRLIIRLKFEPFEIRCFAKCQGKTFSFGVSSDGDIVQIFCRYMHEHHRLLIGRPTAQHTIDNIGSIYPLLQERTLMIKGRDLDSGLPASREISSIEVREQIAPPLEHQTRQLKMNLKFLPQQMKLPEEILVGAAILLRGQYGSIRGLAEAVQQATGLTVID